MDKIEIIYQSLSTKLGELATQYGPDVVDAVLGVTQVTGLQNIVYGLICLIIALVLIKPTFRAYRWVRDHQMHIEHPGPIFTFLGLITAEVILVLNVFDKLANVWNWIAIIQPKLYIAYLVVQKVFN